MKYLLDSNALIYAVRPEPLYLPFRIWANRPDVAVSAISQVEVLGFHSLTVADALFFSIVFDLLPQLAITDAVLQRAVQVRQQFRLKTPDAIIAATALEHELVLVTTDNGFNRVAGLGLIDPLAS